MIYGRVVFTDYRICPLRASLAANISKRKISDFQEKLEIEHLFAKSHSLPKKLGKDVLPRIFGCILKPGHGLGWEEEKVYGFHVRIKNPKMSEIRQIIRQSESLGARQIFIHVNAKARLRARFRRSKRIRETS